MKWVDFKKYFKNPVLCDEDFVPKMVANLSSLRDNLPDYWYNWEGDIKHNTFNTTTGIPTKYIPIIKLLSKALGIKVYDKTHLPFGHVEPVKSFIVVGKKSDLKLFNLIFCYIYHNLDDMEHFIIKREKRKRRKERRKQKRNGEENYREITDARLYASNIVNTALINTKKKLHEILDKNKELKLQKRYGINEYVATYLPRLKKL